MCAGIMLQAIDLHKSHLTHLHVKYFEDLPSIRTIDLSGNVLIVLNLAAFATNNVLRHVDLRANRIRCDAQFEMSIVWLKRNQINVLNDNCRKCCVKSEIIKVAPAGCIENPIILFQKPSFFFTCFFFVCVLFAK